jgi:hypothetical protein
MYAGLQLVDLLLGQLLAMKALQIIASALQTLNERGLDLLPRRSSFLSADAYVVQLHTIKASRKFPHRGIAALSHGFHDRLHLRQHPLHISR